MVVGSNPAEQILLPVSVQLLCWVLVPTGNKNVPYFICSRWSGASSPIKPGLLGSTHCRVFRNRSFYIF